VSLTAACRNPRLLREREQQDRRRGKLDPARDLWVISSDQQFGHCHFQALSGIEPDEGRSRHASEHWNLLGGSENPPLTIDKRRRKHVLYCR